MPCTVIQAEDLVDQLLDPVKFPAWQGERIPFVRKWADRHEDLWMEQYRLIRTAYNPDDPDDYLRARREATEFYEAHREEMDQGCEIGWPYCFEADKGEVSAIQHAYNALIDDGEAVFASEFQNEPFLPPEEEGQLTVDEVYARLNNLKRGDIPTSCERLTAFIDVQGKLLYYAVVAWGMDFTGYVIDYGTYPDQRRRYFMLRQATKTLQRAFPGTGQEGAWRAGLEKLTDDLISREWKRDDGVGLRISRCLIDANDGNAAGTVYDFCRQSAHAAVVMPSRGKGVTASSTPFSDYKRKAGDRISEFNWRIPARQGKNAVRYILFDTNYWKSFIRSRLRVAKGDPGAVTIFGKKPEPHRMLAEQLTGEYSVRTEGRGRIVDEWQMRPSHSDNHFLDCLVGCAVAASEQGVVLPGTGGTQAKKKPPIRLSSIRKGREA
jgi:phage terminase large subunit GpA-like protein